MYEINEITNIDELLMSTSNIKELFQIANMCSDTNKIKILFKIIQIQQEYISKLRGMKNE